MLATLVICLSAVTVTGFSSPVLPIVTSPLSFNVITVGAAPLPAIEVIPVNSGFKEYVKFVPSCLISRLLPALSVILLPSLTSSVDVVLPSAFLPVPSTSDVMENPEELICFSNSSLRFFTSFLTPVN